MRHALCNDYNERVKRRGSRAEQQPRLHVRALRYVPGYEQHAGRYRHYCDDLVGLQLFLENYRAEYEREHRTAVVHERCDAHSGVSVRAEQQHPVKAQCRAADRCGNDVAFKIGKRKAAPRRDDGKQKNKTEEGAHQNYLGA